MYLYSDETYAYHTSQEKGKLLRIDHKGNESTVEKEVSGSQLVDSYTLNVNYM